MDDLLATLWNDAALITGRIVLFLLAAAAVAWVIAALAAPFKDAIGERQADRLTYLDDYEAEGQGDHR